VGRTMGRSAQDTRRALLTAAGDAIRTKGVHASLDDVAHQAGVSKGGLIYHFASKDELILELARDLLTAFRTDLTNHLDPTDTTPGRLTRAYLRTLLTPTEDETAARESIALITQLMTIPAVADLARREADIIKAELDEDGLPPDVLTLVISAADGISSAPLWGATADSAEHHELIRRLAQITRRPHLWQDLDWAQP